MNETTMHSVDALGLGDRDRDIAPEIIHTDDIEASEESGQGSASKTSGKQSADAQFEEDSVDVDEELDSDEDDEYAEQSDEDEQVPANLQQMQQLLKKNEKARRKMQSDLDKERSQNKQDMQLLYNEFNKFKEQKPHETSELGLPDGVHGEDYPDAKTTQQMIAAAVPVSCPDPDQ